jgi:glucans biosynthesis protein
MLGATQARAFSLDDVTAKAKALVDQPYSKPASNLPPVFSKMQFADYMKIQPNADRFMWRDVESPFKLSFYHQGMHFNTPVRISEITADGAVQEMKYDAERFHFGDLHFDKDATSQLGYAGFRVMYPINQEGKQDEIMSILGASYFRVIGKGQIYGLSARGLALDTALPSGEEFPDFREFWIERPKASDKQVVFYALLNSPRATGAYRFVLTPGADSVLDVQARVFMRGDVAKLGIAPLTSMFLFGPNQPSTNHSFRQSLHDSNGLAIHTGSDEWLWRPLNNPKNLNVSTYRVENPKGFGLLQRGRDFARYEDLEDRYDRRPSAWIEPKGNWGKGKVELVEIPTPDETNDNIVAFWTPDEKPVKGQPMSFDYRMHWTTDERALLPSSVAWVKQTLRTAGEVKQKNLIRHLDGSTGLLVDFEGPDMVKMKPDAAVTAQVSVGDNAEVLTNMLQRNPVIGGWRLTLRVRVKDPKQPVEMRAALVENGKTLSETWSYQLPPYSVATE